MALPNEIHPFLVTGNDANQYKVPYSVRIRRSVDAYFSRTFSTPTDQKTWTFSGWFKRGYISLGSNQYIMHARDSGNTVTWELFFGTGDTITVRNYNVSSYNQLMTTNQVFRDPSAWYHIVFVLNTSNSTAADRHRLYINGSRVTSFSSETQPSLNMTCVWNTNTYGHGLAGVSVGSSGTDFDGYMAEVNFIDGQALTPSSFGYSNNITNQWAPKQYTGTYGNNGFYLPFKNNSIYSINNLITYSEQFDNAVWNKSGCTISSNAVAAPNGTTTADKILEDTSNGYHGVYWANAPISSSTVYTMSVYAKASERSWIMLIDGVNSAYTYFDIANGVVGTSGAPVTGGVTTPSITPVGNGWYLCSITFTSGSSQTNVYFDLYACSGNGTSNYVGVTNYGLYLWGAQLSIGSGPSGSGYAYLTTTSSTISSSTQLGQDLSGGYATNSYNSWVTNGISVTSGPTYDSMNDSPSDYDDGGRGRGSYCVLNPIPGIYTGASSNGNLTVTGSSSYSIGTIAPSSGKWYFEAVCNVAAADGSVYFDIRNIYDGGANEITYYASGSTAQIAGSPTFSSYTTGDIVACAYDIDNNTVAFYKNGVLQGSGSYTPSSSIVGLRMTPAFKVGTGKSGSWEVNFGQRPFAYTPPSGFKTLNTFNLANPSLPLV